MCLLHDLKVIVQVYSYIYSQYVVQHLKQFFLLENNLINDDLKHVHEIKNNNLHNSRKLHCNNYYLLIKDEVGMHLYSIYLFHSVIDLEEPLPPLNDGLSRIILV